MKFKHNLFQWDMIYVNILLSTRNNVQTYQNDKKRLIIGV